MSDFRDSLVGTTIADRFRVDEPIGKGGLGIVFSGLHLSLNKPVAIKVLNAQNGVSTESQKRFQQEARITSQLDHQNIVTVYDFGELPNGSSFIVMDLVKGVDLESLLTDASFQNDYTRIVSIFLQVCAGLSHAHQAGVIHRDLTPANIMLTKNKAGEEIVKILDFGLSLAFGPATGDEQRLTREGHVVGTCLYMSPEQCEDLKLDGRSDIYSLGCVLYEVLTGRVPFMGQSALSTLQMQISQEPAPFAEVTGNPIPKEFEDIVTKAMKKNRTQRYQTVDELAADLKKIAQTNLTGKVNQPSAAETKPNTETIKMAPLTPEKSDTSKPESTLSSTEKLQSIGSNRRSSVKVVLAVASVAMVVIAGLVFFPKLQSKNNSNAAQSNTAVVDQDKPIESNNSNTTSDASKASSARANEDSEKWKEYQTQGDKLREDGGFSEAERKYSQSLAELEASGKRDENLVSALKKMSDISYIQGKTKDGQEFDKRALEISKSIQPSSSSASPEEDHRAVIDRLAALAQLCHNDGQCDRAELLLKRSIEIARRVYGPNSKQVNQRLDDLATFYLSLGEDKKADEILKSISSKNK